LESAFFAAFALGFSFSLSSSFLSLSSSSESAFLAVALAAGFFAAGCKEMMQGVSQQMRT
jgi:hypothetical protein